MLGKNNPLQFETPIDNRPALSKELIAAGFLLEHDE
jgi:hypothetical protein